MSWSVIFLLMLSVLLGSRYSRGEEKVYKFADLKRWSLPDTGAEVIEYRGKKALILKAGKGERVAILKDVEFNDGVIELDIAAIPSYTGLVFRARSEHVYEGIYFRPQNSRHPDPARRGHTVQYHAGPRFTWYYLREKSPEKYEAAVDIPPDEWFRVRLVVSGQKAQVFVNDAEKPCLTIDDLKHGVSRGEIGIWCGNGSAGTFANMSIKPLPKAAGIGEVQAVSRTSYTPEQEYLFDVFKNRRSVRKFKSTPVPDEHIMKILDMARSAPTSGNQQPWKFLVIQDREKLGRLKEECVSYALERAKKAQDFDEKKLEAIRERYAKNLEGYLSAPVFVLVLTDKNSRYPSYNIYDGSLAAGYLILAARALGYGTVFTTDSFPFEAIKKAFEIPDNFERICFIPMGIPDAWPDTPKKKPLREVAVFERLIQGVNFVIPIKRKAIELDPNLLGDYTGKYEITAEIAITITEEKGKMYAQATGQPKVDIYPEAKDKFFLKVTDAQITFIRDEAESVTGLVLYQGGRETSAKKIE
jgi:nitroreductase